MARLIQAKQIHKLIAGRVYIGGYAFTAGAGIDSFDATVSITAALLTAGEDAETNAAVAVPLQNYIPGVQQGLITSGRNNLVEVFDTATKLKLEDAGGNEVYGRLSEAAGVYTVTLYSLVAGADVAYVPPANVTIDFIVPYVYQLNKLPHDFATSIKAIYVDDDPGTAGSARVILEQVSVTALNTVANLTTNYSTGPAKMYVNGQVFTTLEGAFTLVPGGVGVTWNQGTTGFNLATTDTVHVEYPY